MITVHHLENSQSIRILWLLEELGVEYSLKHYNREPETSLAPKDFKTLHITGTSPLISDGDRLLPETNAIIDYVLDKYQDKTLRPSCNSPLRTDYLYWFHASQGSFMPLLTSALVFNRLKTRVPFFLKPLMKLIIGRVESMFLQPRINSFLTQIEQQLAKGPWFAGEQFTAADIVMGYCMQVAEVRVGMDDRYPNAHAFLKRMEMRPGYQQALIKNGNFQPLKG